MASLPGSGRYDESIFVIGHKAYIIGGSSGGSPYLNDVWMYDAHSNTWTQMNNSPSGNASDGQVAFAIGNHGYIGGGWDGSSGHNTCWQYDTTNDTWTSIANLPLATGLSGDSRAFVIGSKAYVCTGATPGTHTTLPLGYVYDTASKAWSVFTNMGVNGIERGYAVAFTIGNDGYIATGIDSLGGMLNDLWQWGPPDTTIVANCNVWTQKANFPGAARYYDASFSIGHYGFIGCGTGASYYNDFYKWNQTTNTWTTAASYPGAGYYYSPISFSIEGKGYIGLGYGPSGVSQDLWSYDTTSNTWTQMASLPGSGRYDESIFVIGHKAYIIGGSSGGSPYLNDVWMYDAHSNTWTQMNNSPSGNASDGQVAFAIGNHGYIGGGWDGSSGHNTCWQYDTTNDTWTSIANLPLATGLSGDSRAFVIGSKAYVCTGATPGTHTTLPLGYVYDTASKAWSVFTNMGVNGIERGYAVAFTIGNDGYIATGIDSLGGMLNDLWQYTPCSDTTTGIVSIAKQPIQVVIYPNPSNGMMNLVYNGNMDKGQLQITDLMGRVVDSHEITGTKGQIALNETPLSDGIYFYQVISSGAIITSGKFVIAK